MADTKETHTERQRPNTASAEKETGAHKHTAAVRVRLKSIVVEKTPKVVLWTLFLLHFI